MKVVLRRLDSVCQVTMGQAPAGSAYNQDGAGWPLLAGAGDFGIGIPQATKYTTEKTKLCAKNDVVLGVRATIGVKVLADDVYCLGRGVAGLRPGPDLDLRFLWHWLGHIQPTLSSRGKGATFKQVNREDIGSLEILLPVLSEQRRIAAVLDRAEALGAKRSQALVSLKTFNRAAFIDLFGDPIQNSKGWPERKLMDLGSLDRGVSKHRPRNDPRLLGGPYPLIQTGEVANSDGYIRRFTATYSEAGLSQSKVWPAGTLCITIAANIARTGILTFDACFPDSVVGFRADQEATILYVQTWLSFLQKMLEETAPEVAQKNINLAILRELLVPVPPLELQHSFAKRVKATEALKSAHRESMELLEELFSSLQQRAFSGAL